MSWCTSSVWLQVLPFLDNRHLGSITRLQQIPCVYLLQYQVNCTWYPLQTLYTCVHSNEVVPDWTTFLLYYTVFEGSWFYGSFSVGLMDNYLLMFQEKGDNQPYCWRNVFSCINLLRILNKLTKWKHSRTMVCLHYTPLMITFNTCFALSLSYSHQSIVLF